MKRWLVLAASISAQCCLGVVYAWSTFVPALEVEYGISKAQASMIFGICIACFTVSMIFAGMLQQKHGPRIIAAIGGSILGLGYIFGAASGGEFAKLLIGLGVLAGIGIGFGYVCPLATAVKWFPEKKGLVTGLSVAGFGFGAVIFSKAGEHFLSAGVPVLDIIRWTGIVIGGVVVVSSFFLFVPEESGSKEKKGVKQEKDLIPFGTLLKNGELWILLAAMFCGTFGGLLIVGNLKPIGMSIGLAPDKAALGVALFAIGNSAGRVIWGGLFDKMGVRSISICLFLLAASAILTIKISGAPFFFSSIMLAAFAFGGCFVLFAAQVASSFGTHRVGQVYPLVFLSYGLAGLLGPPTGGWLLEKYSGPMHGNIAVAVIALLGAVMALFYSRRVIFLQQLQLQETKGDTDGPSARS